MLLFTLLFTFTFSFLLSSFFFLFSSSFLFHFSSPFARRYDIAFPLSFCIYFLSSGRVTAVTAQRIVILYALNVSAALLVSSFRFRCQFCFKSWWGFLSKFLSGVRACFNGNVFESDACLCVAPGHLKDFCFHDYRDPVFVFPFLIFCGHIFLHFEI